MLVSIKVAELVSNAVRHGHVPGRDFRLQLTEQAGAVRVEVSDAREERVPVLSAQEPPGDAECGRGLFLVSQLASAWGARPRLAALGKTVWAELHTPPG